MAAAATTEETRVRRMWLLAGVALFLHGVADPAVTFLATNVFEVGYEANPFLRGALNRGAVPYLLIHLPLYIISIGILWAMTWLLQRADETDQRQTYYIALVGFGVIILWGLALVMRNIIVLVRALSV